MATPTLASGLVRENVELFSDSASQQGSISQLSSRKGSIRLNRQTSKFGIMFNVDQQNTEHFILQSIIGTQLLNVEPENYFIEMNDFLQVERPYEALDNTCYFQMVLFILA